MGFAGQGRRRVTALALWLVAVAAAAWLLPLRAQEGGPLILISLDGFRWDYLEKTTAPRA